MITNLPTKQNNSLFGKIKIFLKKLLFKNKIKTTNYEEKVEIQPKNEKNNIPKEQFQKNIKFETKNHYTNEII